MVEVLIGGLMPPLGVLAVALAGVKLIRHLR